MTIDAMNAPLGRGAKKKPRFTLPFTAPQGALASLTTILVIFALWVVLVDNPMGGEPVVSIKIDIPKPADPKAAKTAAPMQAATTPREETQPPASAQPGSQTITIIDGSSGKRQDVTVPGSAPPAATDPKKGANAADQLLEKSRHGMIPRISLDGLRPAEAYARTLQPATAAADAPRIAIVVGGLGISATGTAEALTKLPGEITLAIAPYGNDLERVVARARDDGHEVLLQIPMEPFDYPDNDPGPQTLLATVAPEQNIDRLHWLLARARGYVGVVNFMGARFTASEHAMAPVLRDVSKRGLIFVDDGSSSRSIASQLAGATALSFAKADVVIDAAPTAAEIDRALVRLESTALERGFAVGFASALPVAVDRIAKWAKAASARGIVLIPISASLMKPKSI